jgi:polyisoprenoid-binding protein YceI
MQAAPVPLKCFAGVGAWLAGLLLGAVVIGAAALPAPANAATTGSAEAANTATTKAPLDVAPPAVASGGKLFALSPAQSTVRMLAFRAGKAARFGHNHVLSAPQFKGYFYLSPEGASSSRFALEFRLDQLELDNPEHRAAVGDTFANPLSADAIASTREHMLGEFNMQADQFPFVRIASLEVSGEAPKFAAKVAVELHGQTREMWLPITVRGLPQAMESGGQIVAEGALVLRQSDFGVTPYSVLGGLLAVRDEVIVEFTLKTTNLNAPP